MKWSDEVNRRPPLLKGEGGLYFPEPGSPIFCQQRMINLRGEGSLKWRLCRNRAWTHHNGKLFCWAHDPERMHRGPNC